MLQHQGLLQGTGTGRWSCHHALSRPGLSRAPARRPFYSLDAHSAQTSTSYPLTTQQPASLSSDVGGGPLEPQLSTQGAIPEQQPVAGSSSSEDASAKKKSGGLANRVIFGTVLGLSGGALIITGGLPFLAMLMAVTYQSTKEFYGFITSKGIAKGMAPPPPLVSVMTTVLCISIAALAYFYHGRSGTVMAVAAFTLLVLEVIAIKRPKFAQLASSVFGLFYCGWLPSFWVKLRNMPAAAPAVPGLTDFLAQYGVSWTVGLVVTFTTVACVIAADTGAYFVGKSLGRTKLTDISPKKTVEGALGGLVSSTVVAMAMWYFVRWPVEPLAAAGMGVLIFFSSLFGDLIESIMKRDAGMKDSGDLIPGHGGLLDRIDSYVFTGAVTFFYCGFVLPTLGLV